MKVYILALYLLSGWAWASESGLINIDEFQIEYEIAGKGLTTVLLEAGARASISDWDTVFGRLAKTSKVIRYSRVGNGKSTSIKRHFTSKVYADHASQLLDKLSIREPVVIVAHSYGGSIARDFSAAYPNKVKGLLLLDPSSEHDIDILRAIDLEQGNREIEQIKTNDMASGMSNNYLDFWSKRPLPDYPEIKNIPVTVIASVKTMDNPPNLFFSDQGRKMWGKLWQDWASGFPKGRAELTTKSGHFVQFDEPDLVLSEFQLLVDKLTNDN